MKITHIALTVFTDKLSYQDNLLTKHHKIQGNEVSLITSEYTFNNKGVIERALKNHYVNEDGVEITRLKIKYGLGVGFRFKKFEGLYNTILNYKPDIIFVHGCQYIDISTIVRYVKKHPNTKVYVDNHADFSNSATNWVSKNILHKIIWRYYARKIEPYTYKFYGVLPARVDFLRDIYGIPKEKIELLVMGADDEKIKEACDEINQKDIRDKYGIKSTDFLIMTGGKIDQAKKQTLLLMQVVKEIQREDVKLIVFGSVVEELQNEVDTLAEGTKVQYIGWVNAEDSYKYFATSDLVVFPGRHSVFWEQVVALGIPMIVKHWEGTTHIDIDGNVEFLYEDSVEEIRKSIECILNNKELYLKMKNAAQGYKHKQFLYSEIAKKSIL